MKPFTYFKELSLVMGGMILGGYLHHRLVRKMFRTQEFWNAVVNEIIYGKQG